MQSEVQPEVFSSGFLIFRLGRPIQFLLMQHANRWDLPKGRIDPGETLMQAALRELEEETGIQRNDLWVDPNFQYSQRYTIGEPKKPRLKELIIYLGWLNIDRPLQLTEHIGFRWFDWSPPHTVQPQTIDPLLKKVELHFASNPVWPPEGIER